MIEPYYKDEYVTLYCANCLDVLPQLSGVTACVTDPPYGLSFMGKEWDHGVPGEAFWRAIAGACLPGAMMLAFGGTRTYHRMTCAIEDAGWEIRDCLMWLYGSGFPKSLDIGKSLDKAAGAEREVVGKSARHNSAAFGGEKYGEYAGGIPNITAPATDAAKLWHGYGTALKPAYEPIVLAMNPLSGTFAANALEHGVAGINVDGGRVGTDDVLSFGSREIGDGIKYGKCKPTTEGIQNPQGRWPANILHDGSDEVLAGFPVTGASKATPRNNGEFKSVAKGRDLPHVTHGHDDTGGTAARFFKCCPQDEPRRAYYCAKASRSERSKGLDKCELIIVECWQPTTKGTQSWEKADQKVRLLVDTGQSPSRVIAVSGAPNNDASEWNTLLCGSGSTEKSLLDAAYTTITGISSTIDSKTLSALLTLNTSASTAGASSETENGGNPAESATHGILSATTTSERMASALGVGNAALPMRLRISASDALDANRHPTVKSLSLMKYLCTLVTMPERNLILDAFAGSGTTGVACKELGLPCILIEQDAHHCDIIAARCAAARRDEQPKADRQLDLLF